MNIKLTPSRFLAVLLISLVILSTQSCLQTLESMVIKSAQGEATGPAFTNAEAIAAMKDALNTGISKSSHQLSQENAYFGNELLKILLPPEAAPIINSVSKIPGGQKLVDDVVLRLNRTAEEAAKEVVPIFARAISEMTVADGIVIVTGKKDAATKYLQDKTSTQLLNLYTPKVQEVLQKPLVLGVSAQKSWDVLIQAYNKAGKIPNEGAKMLGKPEPMPAVTVNLSQYATQKALDGLFHKVAEEEAVIRAKPLEYASQMIQKVFGAVLKGVK